MITLKCKLICVALEMLVKCFPSPKNPGNKTLQKNILLFPVWERY